MWFSLTFQVKDCTVSCEKFVPLVIYKLFVNNFALSNFCHSNESSFKLIYHIMCLICISISSVNWFDKWTRVLNKNIFCFWLLIAFLWSNLHSSNFCYTLGPYTYALTAFLFWRNVHFRNRAMVLLGKVDFMSNGPKT